MQKHYSFRLKPLAVATSAALLVGFGTSAVNAADNLPDMGSSAGQPWRPVPRNLVLPVHPVPH